MKKIIGVMLLASTVAQGAEVCRIWTIHGTMVATGISECTKASDSLRIEVRHADVANSGIMCKLLIIKALTERGYSMMGDGETFIRK